MRKSRHELDRSTGTMNLPIMNYIIKLACPHTILRKVARIID